MTSVERSSNNGAVFGTESPRGNMSASLGHNVKRPVTVEHIVATYSERRAEAVAKLEDFARIGRDASDQVLFEEMVFCFFTGGCSARMGINSLNAVRPILMTGDREELTRRLLGVHRYPNARSGYIVHSRQHLIDNIGMRLRERLFGFACDLERRDWLVNDRGIKGLGYKEASHYLRNIGFRGYAILDKHILRCMSEIGLIDEPKPPSGRRRYIEVEAIYHRFADEIEIDPDELDLILWSMKTGKILK